MEGGIVLFLAFVIVVFAIGSMREYRISKRNRQNASQTYRSFAKHNRNASQPDRVEETFEPFDAESAQPEPSKTLLTGYARIVDGDTLVIKKTQIRMFGIDAPEITHPYGQKAKWALVSLCKGQTVQAEVIEHDNHGRAVARCTLQDGRDLSAEMVKLGLAIDWPKFSDGKYNSLELTGVRKKLWLADARQKGRMHVWQKFEANQKSRKAKS